MSNAGEIVDLRVILKGDVAKRFKMIKSAKGVSQNTEVIRLIVNDFFKRHEEDLTKYFPSVKLNLEQMEPA